MGFFRHRATDAQFQDINRLTQMPIDSYAPITSNPRQPSPPDVRTIIHRLAYLISRTARSDTHWKSAMLAKWYLGHLSRLTLSQEERNLLQNFVDRLAHNILAYEQAYGMVAIQDMDRLVEFAGYRPERILYGPTLFSIIEPSFGTPRGDLSKTISFYGWRQNWVENWR